MEKVVFSVSKLQIWERFTTCQLQRFLSYELFSVCQSYKFESDSQRYWCYEVNFYGCFQCVKVTNLRAIHNPFRFPACCRIVVFSVSKLQIWERFTRKQIYLYWLFAFQKYCVSLHKPKGQVLCGVSAAGGATAPCRFFVGNTFLTLDSNKMGKNARSIVWKNIFIYSE